LYVVVEVRRLLRCLSATPEGVLNLAIEGKTGITIFTLVKGHCTDRPAAPHSPIHK